MNRTLSVLLPVANAQSMLGPLMGRLLEILPELTSKFELLVVDQGSTDDTADMARELAAAYPQVACMSLPWHLNLMEVLRRGLAQTSGDLVLLCEPDCRADLDELPKLWNLSRAYDLVVGITSPIVPPPHGPAASGPQRPYVASRLQLLQRRVTWAWLSAETDEPLEAYLSRKRYRTCEVSIRESRRIAYHRPTAVCGLAPRPEGNVPRPNRLDPPGGAAGTPATIKRPSYLSYLSRFKTFALGE